MSMPEKYWSAALEKQAMAGVVTSQTSPRASSAWSTQDGYVQFQDPERDTSLEVCDQGGLWR